VGDAWCFVLDALSYLAVIVSLLCMRLTRREHATAHAPLLRRLIEGFRYSFGFAPIRALLLLLALVSFMGMPYSVLLPLFATDILGGGPYALGFLSSAAGVGALSGAIYLASRTTVLGLGRQIVIATCLFGLGLIGFARSENLWLSLGLMVVTGFGMMVQMAASNTILQTIVDEDKRGRVMSFYSMAFLGMAPFGSLFAGVLTRYLGAPNTVLVGGIACLVAAGLFALSLPRLRAHVHPIYSRLGILPEVAAGMQSATEIEQPPRA
jgi:MFS family permease